MFVLIAGIRHAFVFVLIAGIRQAFVFVLIYKYVDSPLEALYVGLVMLGTTISTS